MNNDFITQFTDNIKFSYSIFDRVICRGYVLNLFFEGELRNFLKSVGYRECSPWVLRSFTDQLNDHIVKEAERYTIPIHWWPSTDGGKGGAKQEFVDKNYAGCYKGKGNYTYCIITNRETVGTFASREMESFKGKKYHKLYKARKQVKQYYIYFHDEVLGGPCYLKISSYLPFDCEFYFNGHNYARLRLERQGISYRMKDNAFVDVGDPSVLDIYAREITGTLIQSRINYWMNRYFKFFRGSYSTRSKYLVHNWYNSQVEICSNAIFKSSRYCTNLFERLLDKFHRLGLPESISQIFSQRPGRSNSKSTQRLYNNNACVKHWFRGNSIKMYNKQGYFLRSETTINNPKSLGELKLKKPAIYLQSYYWFGVKSNDRFLSCCADVDISSLGELESDTFNKPVVDPTGHKITAPDLRKDRQVALLKELISPKYLVNGFRTMELKRVLGSYFRNSAQIRYEMKKLIARKVVIKLKGKSFYRVIEQGWKWLWLSISSFTHFTNPMISKVLKKQGLSLCTQPSKIEQAYELLNRGLSLYTQEMAMKA